MLRQFFWILLLSLWFTPMNFTSYQQSRPHIVFILADDFGWNDVSFHGSPQIPTPNLDALAYSGLLLQNYYVTPLCTPSRSALMTGKHPIHTGMQHDVIYGSSRYGLPLSETTLPDYLKNLGYRNHIVGKWHLGHYREVYTPLHRGFDSHYGYWGGHQDYYDHTSVQGDSWGYDMRRNRSVDWSAYGHYTTRLLSDKSCSIIAEHNSSTPLFLYIAHLAVHSANPYAPLQAPEETVSLFTHIKDPQRRRYAAMVHELDRSVGRLILSLSDRNMLKDTIIIFSSDNGGPAAGFNSNAASNWPLKGVKNTPWEGGVRAVGLVWSPLIPSERRGQIMDGLMDISDWLPTLYEAAGGTVSDLKPMDGTSQWNSFLYGVPSRRSHILHNIDDQLGYAAIRHGDFKLVKGTTYGGSWDDWYGPSGREDKFRRATSKKELDEQLTKSDVSKALSKVGIKLNGNYSDIRRRIDVNCGKRSPTTAVECLPLEAPCLFDIRKDPCEFDNLAARRPELVRELLDLLHWYNSTAVPPLNTPADPLSNPKFWNYTYTNWVDYI